MLLPGAVAAAIIGVALSPIAFLGTMIYGLGLVGFTPILTAVVYGRAVIEAANVMTRSKSPDVLLFGFMGFISAGAIPALLSQLIRSTTGNLVTGQSP